MPFDSTENKAQLNREVLIRELRERPPEWWDYRECNTCAIEVSRQLGLVKGEDSLYIDDWLGPLEKAFDLTFDEAFTVFAKAKGAENKADRSRITASDVADELEKIL